MTTQKQIRNAFWAENPNFKFQTREAGIFSKGQNAQCATVRCAFIDYVDYLFKSGQITEKLAHRVTL